VTRQEEGANSMYLWMLDALIVCMESIPAMDKVRVEGAGTGNEGASMPRFGPDISHHQEEKNVDLARAKPHVDFVFLKATEGTTVVDETFKTRWQKLTQLGIPRGAYHFARPGDASAQAAHFVKVVKTQNGFRAGDVAIIDVENPNKEPHLWDGTTPTALRAFVDRFVKDVRQGLQVETVVLYTGLPFWNKNFGHPPKLPANCVGWLSRYRAAGPYGGNFPRPAAWPDPPDIWQFTDGVEGEGKPKPRDIPGIGTVDTSEMTVACFQRLFHADLPPPVPKFPGTLKPGATGDGVRQVQRNLNKFLKPDEQLKFTGTFDDPTEKTLREWQKARLIPEPSRGVVGPGTWDMLFAPRFLKNLQLNPVSKGTAVGQLKHALNQYQGNNLDTTNDTFDKDTHDAVRNWQGHRFQRDDGIVDMVTWYWIHAPHIPPDKVPKLHPN
jgi:GH25 family lysozyme M1 (1,4-beta-N-acetylmuramidase)